MGTCAAVQSIAAAGSIRRWKETTGDIDILVASTAPRERYAVGTAGRGGATADQVVNTRDYAGLRRWLRPGEERTYRD